jgi:hypothetical protein
MDESDLFKGFGLSVTLVAGYVFIRCSPYRRYRSEHLRTDRFALHVLLYALFVYAFGVAIESVAESNFSGSFAYRLLFGVAKYTRLDEPVLCALVAAPVLGILDRFWITLLLLRDPAVMQKSWLHPLIKSRTAANARFVTKCDDAGIRLLYRAIFFRKPLLITLSSGKIYIGEPVGGLGDPSVRAQSIKLVPRASGYRNSDTHKVEITTRYTDLRENMVLRDNKEPSNPDDPLEQDLADLTTKDGIVEVDIQDMGIVILWSEIQTLSLYDPNIYQAFQDAGSPKGPEKDWSLLDPKGIIARFLFRD